MRFFFWAIFILFLSACSTSVAPQNTTPQKVTQQIESNTQEAEKARQEYLRLQQQRQNEGLNYAP